MQVLNALVDSGRMKPAEMAVLKRLIDSLQANVDAQARLIRELAGGLESALNIHGPDAGTRCRLRKLASTIADPAVSVTHAFAAAQSLSALVLQSIPAPRPVAVPSPVVEQRKTGGSHGV